ncbi:MAG: type II toxin-antitoxin system HicB family antitoxin [Crocinitomicaceae bacterium]|nr:type II toxin-antitoxin system HicB family antitoxin [Crocinitomicaceae bacterium]MBK8926841.1 type II toxin-antitoxin system HicB family antitoxin [Crocinitomicaceae bacterium]
MTNRTYRLILAAEPDGGFTVTVPALPGCITHGDSLEHALRMGKEAIEGYILLLKEMGEDIPDDSNTFEYSLTMAS